LVGFFIGECLKVSGNKYEPATVGRLTKDILYEFLNGTTEHFEPRPPERTEFENNTQHEDEKNKLKRV